MVRTQLQLPDEQDRRLRRAAKAEGVSISEIVRRCIERGLDAEAATSLWQRALEAGGAFNDPDPIADVSRRHDDYLAGTYR